MAEGSEAKMDVDIVETESTSTNKTFMIETEKKDCSESLVYEKNRMNQLRNAVERTVTRCVDGVKLQYITAAFPALNDKKPKAIKSIHDQQRKQLLSSILEEMELMFSEECIPEKMDELDRLVAKGDAEGLDNNWRPSGQVSEDVRPHIMGVKQKQKEFLTDLLKNIQSDNSKVYDIMVRKRRKLLKTVEESKLKDDNLKKIVDSLS